MIEATERAVADFLGADINWEKLKPIVCFVVLWNRLELRHGKHVNVRKLEQSVALVVVKTFFDIARYTDHVRFFQNRYSSSPHLLPSLFHTGKEPTVEKRVEDLIAGRLPTSHDTLLALMMLPYRIRNNLFHGNKATVELYSQVDLFNHVNHILCLFHEDLDRS